MALRIAVNGELEALEQLLAALPKVLKAGGRAAIISFHSLEDRLVKQAFARWDKQGLANRLTKKPITAAAKERSENPRSRSAKLRVIRWIGRND
jgi:16S rRNA (cytosine1402-N4)-methyltransferase